MPISFGGSGVEITLELDRPSGPYYPRDVVQVEVTLDSDTECKIAGLRVGLLAWELSISEDSEGYSSKRQTVDEVVAEETLLAGLALPAGFHASYQVALPIPADAFPPYHSSSIRSGWLVRATLDRGMKKDSIAEVEVPLVVPPPGEQVQPGEYGVASHPGEVDMRLWLPGLEWVEGSTIEGNLVVMPRKSLDASEVRIQLKRQEKVHVPRFKSSSTDYAERVVLAGKTRFEAGQATEMVFSFPVPVMGRPTRSTDSTTVSYTLQASLSRRLRKDYMVGIEIMIFNGQKR
ncbi:MAG TPA: hypothetical protein VLY63_18110 [Anaerolineae bacterium]|nr:hypothetical protein [Anaerolineae bacterium]